MPKFARPTSYTGKQANQQWTGDTRFANSSEATAGASKQLAISPATLASTVTLLNTSPAPVGPAVSPEISNGRLGQVIFSGVSIAAGATQSFSVANSYIKSGMVIACNIYGCTAGAALTISSVTAANGSFAIVVANGTGATTSIANITVTFEARG